MGYHFLENRWLKQYIDVPTVTVSESTRQDLLNLGFKYVSVVPEGLNFEPIAALSKKDVKPIVVFSGRLKRAKRPDHAVKAFAKVKEKYSNAELWVFGDGPFRKNIENKAGLGVQFFGHLDSSKRRELLAKSWILMAPGLREGWGLNIIEANALGVPCVAYDVPGLRDSVKNGETGILVESGNIESLAQSMISLLENPVKLEMLSLNALNYAKEFNWDKTANEFIAQIS